MDYTERAFLDLGKASLRKAKEYFEQNNAEGFFKSTLVACMCYRTTERINLFKGSKKLLMSGYPISEEEFEERMLEGIKLFDVFFKLEERDLLEAPLEGIILGLMDKV